jgi:hypothetical protein
MDSEVRTLRRIGRIELSVDDCYRKSFRIKDVSKLNHRIDMPFQRQWEEYNSPTLPMLHMGLSYILHGIDLFPLISSWLLDSDIGCVDERRRFKVSGQSEDEPHVIPRFEIKTSYPYPQAF